MELHLRLDGRRRLGEQVYRQLRAAILDGRLRPGDGLPPTRELARRLSLGRNTVTGAYQRLTAEGYLLGRAGGGTIVHPQAVVGSTPRRAPAIAPLRPRPAWRSLAVELLAPELGAPPRLDLRIGVPDPALFPWDEWRPRVARGLRASRARAPGYRAPAGHPALRAAIARHVGLARAARAGADDVVVTSGAQQALDLIARVLVEPGDRVAVEDPGYPPARRVFEVHGARVAPVPVDGEGLVVEALPADARVVYVTPSHQFPLGVPMSLPRRLALLAWASRRGAAIVEDDYDGEFRFEGRPLEPLQNLDPLGRVLYVGSFSKVLRPGLRLGFVVAPGSVAPALAAARALTDWHGPEETQAALAALIDDGVLARHVRRAARVYRARRERLLGAIAEHLGDELELVPSCAGLHLSGLLRPRVDDVQLAASAAAAGVGVQPLSPYHVARPRPGLALGYGLVTERRIDEAVRRLAACVRAAARRASRGGSSAPRRAPRVSAPRP